MVAADRIASHYFRALFNEVAVHAHNLWKIMEVADSAFFMKNMKTKRNQNKLHFKKRWLLLELVADVLKLFLVVLNVFRAC